MSSSRGSRSGPPRPFKVLCVSSLHSKASDDVIRDTLYREYKKYGDISVRVIIEPDERVAYVYFRNFDDAEDASVEVEEGKSEMMPSTKTFVSFIPFQKSCQQ